MEGQSLGRVEGRRITWLNVAQSGEQHRLTKGLIKHVTVSRHINTENHTRKVDMHPHVIGAHKTTTLLMQVCTKTVEWDLKCQN
jgi:hypothetical protein